MNKIKRFIFTATIIFLFWLAYTSSLAKDELITGLIVSLIVAFFTYESFTRLSSENNIAKRFLSFLKYLPIFIIEMIKANIDVAKRVINPSLPINPGIVAIKTDLKSDQAKMLLANSITLTPGTLTVDIIDDTLYVHWIDVESEKPQLQKNIIASKFENLIKGVF
ncbi:MAG: Na+/H+ antiporter subunit E [Halanaerobiales bacterium]